MSFYWKAISRSLPSDGNDFSAVGSARREKDGEVKLGKMRSILRDASRGICSPLFQLSTIGVEQRNLISECPSLGRIRDPF